MSGYTPSKSIIALIPARAGSVRIPGKNMKVLAGHPLLAYTIAAAQQSGIFRDIVVSTNDPAAGDLAKVMGVVQSIRPDGFATSDSPDVEWVQYTLGCDAADGADCFAILRPTSPFRSAKTIQRAWAEYKRSACDSLRAVQPAGVNPYKLWWMQNCELTPLLPTYDVPPWHSRPTQTLPPVYQQNASLEISKCSLVRDRLYPSITGPRIWGFLNPEPDGFDVNTLEDWARAEAKIASGEWMLPRVE